MGQPRQQSSFSEQRVGLLKCRTSWCAGSSVGRWVMLVCPIGHSVMGRRETQGGSILHAGQMEALLDGNVGFFIVKFIN